MKTTNNGLKWIRAGWLGLAASLLVSAEGLAQTIPGSAWEALAEGGAAVALAQDPAAAVDGTGTNATRITISQVGKRFGIVCHDPGIAESEPGQWYDLSFNARTTTRKTFALIVSLESPDGKTVSARTTLPEVGRTNWAHYTLALHIRQPVSKPRLVIALADTGSLWLDDLSVVLRPAAGATARVLALSGVWPVAADDTETGDALALNGAVTAAGVAPYVRNAFLHDPSTLIKCNDEFWVFPTGRGVPSWHSKDLVTWVPGPAIFTNQPPAWVAQNVSANRGLGYWAPDVTYLDGRYLLYFSASSFGKCVSGIGLVTSTTLDPNDPAYGWTDQGLIVASTATDDFNAIDPAIFHDTNGSLWLTFGSFWNGINLIQLDAKTGKRLPGDQRIYPLAHYDSIEASYLYQHGGYYYLFVDWGMCCRGTNSTYSIHVGRSRTVTGPYLDRQGADMLYGGGTMFLDTTRPYIGPGHAGIIVDHGTNWFSCHYEAGASPAVPGQRRASPLAVMPLRWRPDDWPELDLKYP